jgi:hypothetical protein
MIQEIDDLRGFLESAENLPEVVIVGLDLWWFNAARKAPGGLTRAAAFEAATDWQAHLKAIRRLKSRKVIRPAWNAFSRSSDHIGVEARATGMGFRWDGSIQYSVPVPKDWSSWTFVDRERPPVVERILGEDGVFVPCPGISREQISVLDDCLDRLSAKGVLVLGFLPPFSSEAAALLASSPGQSNLWNEAHVQLAQAFERKGQPFVDASLTAKLGLDDRHLIDGMHPGETFHLHLLLKFLEDPRVQSRFSSSRERLAALARAPETNPWYPRYPGQAGD